MFESSLAKRARAFTLFNSQSSRSHLIFPVHLEQNNISANGKLHLTSKIDMVDLAGSENLDQLLTTDPRHEEGVQINSSLTHLNIVLNCLAEKSTPSYRGQTLSMLVKDSLSGNAHALMIACVSAKLEHAKDTERTLTYVNLGEKISFKPKVNSAVPQGKNTSERMSNLDLKIAESAGTTEHRA